MSIESFSAEEKAVSGKNTSRRDFLKGMLGVAAVALGGLPSAERKEKENPIFNPEVQGDVFGRITEKMKMRKRIPSESGDIPLPAVVNADMISSEEFRARYGSDTGGKRTNFFSPPDTIYLRPNSKVHNLAHEYVHYLQHRYHGDTDAASDETENEAVVIQNWFRGLGIYPE